MRIKTTNEPQLRLFTAINFPDDVKRRIVNVQRDLKTISSSGRFSDEANLHLTLVFLGETPLTRVDNIKRAMEAVNTGSFTITLEGMGRFKRDGGDIIWISVKPSPALSNMHKQLSTALATEGFVVEKREYKPHLTLAREAVLRGDLNEVDMPTIEVSVDRISLMKSEHIRGRLVYTEVFHKSLNALY